MAVVVIVVVVVLVVVHHIAMPVCTSGSDNRAISGSHNYRALRGGTGDAPQTHA